MVKSCVFPKVIFAVLGITATNFWLRRVRANSLLFILCICPFGDTIYSICLILFGSTSCVVVAKSFVDFVVILFTTLSFSEKYPRWFPRSVQKRLRYMILSFSFGRTLSCTMNLSYPGI